MKKFLKVLIIGVFLLTGCGIKSADNVLGDLEKKLNKANSYYLEGTMEIMNNEDTYTYNVKVSYQKKDYYKIELVNTLNNHEQVILKNNDGVYVVTPSLNKSFKFQSDWPYNNSQVYLLDSVILDLKEDEDREFKSKENGYLFTSDVNYPNNKTLVKQHVYINKKGNITKVEVVDKDNNVEILMKIDKQTLNKKFAENYFELNNILDMNTKSDTNSGITKNNDEKNTTKNDNTTEKNNSESSTNNNNTNSNDINTDTSSSSQESTDKEKTTAKINDVIYPMYLPDNTYLTSQDKVDTDSGSRLILTFGGDSSFVLVEETASKSEDGVVIPVSGEFDFLSDVIGVIGSKSLSWHSNGIDYYMTSDTLEVSELVSIARSVSVLPVSK